MRLILGIIALVFGATFFEYIMGRILLPEVGLSAPGYWTWIWVTFFAGVGYLACGLIVDWMKKDE